MGKQSHLILGASSGLGKSLALQLINRKQSLILVARRKKLMDDFISLGAKENVVTLGLDLSDQQCRSQLTHFLQTQKINLDIVFFCASQMLGKSFLQSSLDEKLRLMNLNLFSMVSLIHSLMNECKPKKIILISSEAAFYPIPTIGLYSASKSFVHQLGLALHEECKEAGTLVQVYVPPAMDTTFDQDYFNNLKIKRYPSDQVATQLIKSLKFQQPEIFFKNQARWGRYFSQLFPTQWLLKILKNQFK